MNIEIIKQPNEFCFTGSPVNFSFILTPYRLYDRTIDIKVNILLLIEQGFENNVFAEEYGQQLYPDKDGRIDIDIKSLLDPHVQYYIPDADQNIPEVADGQSIRFKLVYKLIINNEIVPIGDAGELFKETDVFIAIKGGMSYPVFSPVLFFQNMADSFRFLGKKAGDEITHPSQKQFLYYLCNVPSEIPIEPPGVDAESYRLVIFATDEDGNNYTVYKTLENKYQKGRIFVFPAGYEQLNIQSLIPSGKLCVKYVVSVELIKTFESTIYPYNRADKQFVLDHRAYYNTHTLFYFNSAGGFDSLFLRGQVDYEAEYETQEAIVITPPDYFTNLVPDAQIKVLKPEETQRSKGFTGFFTKEDAEYTRDLFLSPLVFENKYNKLVPVVINNRNVKFYANRDSLISLQVEWKDAYQNPFFTDHKQLPPSVICPAVEHLSVIQLSKNSLQIRYALQSPNDLAQVIITINSVEYEYFYRGNVAVITQLFENPMDPGDPPLTIQVKIRTVCNLYSTPQSFGPWLNISLPIEYELLPVAKNDVFEVPGGLTAPLQLPGSILTNDYDPDGDFIEAVEVSGAITDQGGTVDIDEEGTVTYLPPSSLFVGQDFFDYQMRNIGSSTTVTARIFFNVRRTVVNVYAKVVLRNIKYESQFQNILGIKIKIGNYTTADVFIEFFSDPLGTVPLDVKALGLDVDYRRTTTTESPTPGVVTDDYTFNTGTTFLRSKTRHAVSTQEIIAYQVTTDIPGVTKLKYYKEYKLVAGTGYIII